MCVTQWALGTGCLVVGVLLSATSGATLALGRPLFKITAVAGMVTGWTALALGVNLIVKTLA